MIDNLSMVSGTAFELGFARAIEGVPVCQSLLVHLANCVDIFGFSEVTLCGFDDAEVSQRIGFRPGV